VVAAWRRAWDRVIPFFAFPPAVRRVIYTTDEIDKPSRCADSMVEWVKAGRRPPEGLGLDALGHRTRLAVARRAGSSARRA
jgi:hypothetical protein